MKCVSGRRRARSLGLVILALAAVACGASAADPFEPSDPASSIASSSNPAATSPSSVATNATATDDRPAAPDFTLVLGDGASYTLSADPKPVYLVFWAEW